MSRRQLEMLNVFMGVCAQRASHADELQFEQANRYAILSPEVRLRVMRLC